jgi:hypothetical protein
MVRVLGVIIIILGLVGVVFGVMFFPQANSAQQKVADELAPLTLDKLDAQYDVVVTKFHQLQAAEEPNIQAGKAAPSSTYAYISAQRALLGLAKSNVATVNFVMYMGIVCIALGVGLAATGVVLVLKK